MVSPSITLEYNERNSFLLTASISYNRRTAKKELAFTGDDLRQKLELDFARVGIFLEDRANHAKDALAIEKRALLEQQHSKEAPTTLLPAPQTSDD